ncbi:MAG TPA: hypothetical protein VFD16_01015 [Candidatus Saccharimonadales bacterium]|nr:hypothetical protein [Candidatus Saccharimonadales bacterium]
MAKNGKGWKLLVSSLVGATIVASLHFYDGYPWLNCMLWGLIIGFFCFGMLAMVWYK